MRIALATVGDPRDVRLWAGTPYHLVKALRSRGVEVELVGPLARPGRIPMKAFELGHNALRTSVYRFDREPYLQASYARQIRRSLRSMRQVDFVLSLGVLPVSALSSQSPPVVIWTDATLSVMLDYYDVFTGWSPRTLRNAQRSEAQALQTAALFVATSEWARQAAIKDYRLDETKTACVMYGANLDDSMMAPAARVSANRTSRLILVGVDWERKGVDVAIRAVGLMRESGLDVELDVVGALPPSHTSVPSFVSLHGFLDKNKSDERHILETLYNRASAFILPTRAECTAVVLCEAAAFGLPAIVPDTGGLRAIVEHGRTGYVVPEGSAPEAYAHAASRLLSDSNHLATFSTNARREFERRLNWRNAVDEMLTHVNTVGICAPN